MARVKTKPTKKTPKTKILKSRKMAPKVTEELVRQVLLEVLKEKFPDYELSSSAQQIIVNSLTETDYVLPIELAVDNGQGWLLYGAGQWQISYLKFFKEKGLVNETQKTENPSLSNYYINFNTDLQLQYDGKNTETPYSSSIKDQATSPRKEFYNRFDQSVLSIKTTRWNELAEGVKKSNRDFIKPSNKPYGNYSKLATGMFSQARKQVGEINHLVKNFAVRRACKYLLREKTVEGWYVLYVLDDLNVQKAAKGEYLFLDESNIYKLPICTTELREIFRNWNYYQDKVAFFLNYKHVPPPWYDESAIDNWAGYAKALAQKSNNPLKETDSAAKIKEFHSRSIKLNELYKFD